MAKPVIHTSMRGVQINMAEMRARNEDSIAVTGAGSMVPRMNARGDTLKKGGRIDRTREDIDAAYQTQLTGNAKRIDIRAVEADTFETPQQVVERLQAEKIAKEAEKPATPKQETVKPAPAAPVQPQAKIDNGLEQIIAETQDKQKVEPATPRARKFVEKED